MTQDLRTKSFRNVAFIILPFLYLFILLFQQEKAFTQDLGRHLKTGEIIVHCLCVSKINAYSYVESNHPFINHHWFSEVIFYELSVLLGLNSIIILKILLIVASFSLVWWMSYKRAGPVWTGILAIPYLSLFSYRFDARPELFSFLFMALFIFLIEKYRLTKLSMYLVPLPFIEFFWVNMHIYFIVGILFYGAFLCSELIRTRKQIDPKILIVGGCSLFATLLNPNGISGALTPTTILQHYGYSIIENQNIFFLNSVLPTFSIFVFEVLVVFGAGILLPLKKWDWLIIFLFLGTTIVGAYMVRNFPIFVLATFPYIPEKAGQLEKKFEIHTRKIIIVLVLVCVFGFFLYDSINHLSSPIRGFSYYIGAQDAIDFYQKNHLTGPLFNNFDIGSYIIYRLYPQEKVYVDGRPEAYSVPFFDEYKKMQEDPAEFAKQDAKYHFNTIIFSHTDITPWAQSFLSTIVKDPQWVPVYIDPMMVILVKNISKNGSIIQKYRVTL